MKGYLPLAKGMILRIAAGDGEGLAQQAATLKVKRRVRGGWHCSDVVTGSPCMLSDTETVALDAADRLTIEEAARCQPINWSGLPPAIRAQAVARKNAIDLLRTRHGEGPYPRKLLDNFAKEVKGKPGMPKRISRGSLTRWIQRSPPLQRTPASLLNAERSRGRRLQSEASDIVEKILERSLRRRYPLSNRQLHILVDRAIKRPTARSPASTVASSTHSMRRPTQPSAGSLRTPIPRA